MFLPEMLVVCEYVSFVPTRTKGTSPLPLSLLVIQQRFLAVLQRYAK